MNEVPIEVRIAEIKVSRSPARLVTYGLGSCVGVTLYDPLTRVGGMVHVMLPESRLHSDRTTPGKYADTGIVQLLEELRPLGFDPARAEAKLIGGANMFKPPSGRTTLTIGLRNIMAARRQLEMSGLRVVAEDVGGKRGRTATFDLADGSIALRSFNEPNRRI
jgi:chemotaxis protein CheD